MIHAGLMLCTIHMVTALRTCVSPCDACVATVANCVSLFTYTRCQVLSDRMTELNTALGRTGLRMESVETTSRQLGESCESSRVVQGNCYSEAVIVVFLVLLKRNNAVPVKVLFVCPMLVLVLSRRTATGLC
jgi:hypothetical protein